MSLLSVNEFNKISSEFRVNNKTSKDLTNKLNDYVEDNTKNEKQQLELAIKKYNDKVKSIMEEKKTDIERINNYNKKISETLTNTFTAFQEASQSILDNNSLSSNEKKKKIQELSNYIMNNLYTKEEIDEFKSMANNVVILLPNENEGFSRRVQAIEDVNKKNIRYY